MIDDKNIVPEDTNLLWQTEYKISNLTFAIDDIGYTKIVAGMLHYCILGKHTERKDYQLIIGEESVSWSEGSGSHLGHIYYDFDFKPDDFLKERDIITEKTSEGHLIFEYKGLKLQARSKEQACLKVVLNSETIVFPEQIIFDFDEIYPYYIKSKLWQAKATVIKAAAGNKCSKCDNTKRLHCHHLTYDRLGQELPTDLLCVCESCHKAIHGKKSY